MTSKETAECESGHIAEFRRENDVTQVAVCVSRIGQETEMAKHPADVYEADNGERHSLQFAARTIPRDRDEQDERNRENRHGNEECVPTRARFPSARIGQDTGCAEGENSGVAGARHPPVAIQSGSAREFLEAEDG